MNKVTKKVLIKITRYAASASIQALLPSEEIIQKGIKMEHRFVLQRVDRKTVITHRFSKDTPTWGRLLFRRLFRLLAQIGSEDPREFCRGWLHFQFKFSFVLTPGSSMTVTSHPFFVLALIDQKAFSSIKGQIEAFVKLGNKRKEKGFSTQPLDFYNTMAKILAKDNSDKMEEEKPEAPSSLHDVPMGS